MDDRPAPTIRSLARKARVCATTVSLALRNHSSIGAATRERIQKLAQREGYCPDPVVAKLMLHLRQRRSRRIKAAICALTTWPASIREPFVDQVCAAAAVRAKEMGYAFSRLCIADYPSGSSRLQRVLQSRGVEGLVLLPMRSPVSLLNLVDWSLFSVVAASYSVQEPRFHTVVPDHFNNLMRACQNLRSLGFRRIGLILSSSMDLRANHYFTAAIAWQNCFSAIEPVPPLFDAAPFAKAAGWLKRERPDVVIVERENEFLAWQRLHRPSIATRLPVISLSILNSEQSSGIDENRDDLGETAIDILSGLLHRGVKGIPASARRTLVEGSWVFGPQLARRKLAQPNGHDVPVS